MPPLTTAAAERKSAAILYRRRLAADLPSLELELAHALAARPSRSLLTASYYLRLDDTNSLLISDRPLLDPCQLSLPLPDPATT